VVRPAIKWLTDRGYNLIHGLLGMWLIAMVLLGQLVGYEWIALGWLVNIPSCLWYTRVEIAHIDAAEPEPEAAAFEMALGNIVIALAPWAHATKVALLFLGVAAMKLRGPSPEQ